MSYLDKNRILKHCTHARDIIAENKVIVVGAVAAVAFLATSVSIAAFSETPKDGRSKCDNSEIPTHVSVPDSCPWQMVLSDMAHRVRLLEMAFKEQAKARELLSLELANQTGMNEALRGQLEKLSTSIKQISHRIDNTNERMNQLSARLYSDECLGFLILLCLVIQIVIVLRAKFIEYNHKTAIATGIALVGSNSSTVSQNCSTVASPLPSTDNNGISTSTKVRKISPKYNIETCLVLFNPFKQNQQLLIRLLDACCKSPDESKLLLKTAYVIDSEESLQRYPDARFYIITIGSLCSENSGKRKNSENKEPKTSYITPAAVSRSNNLKQEQQQQPQQQQEGHQKQHQHSAIEIDLLTKLIGNAKEKGAQILMVIINDEASARISNTALYNTNHPWIKDNDFLQDLALNGRICSIWNEFSLYQLNHMKKIYKSIVNS